MKKIIVTTSLVFFCVLHIFSQEISIDIVIHEEAENIEYQLDKFIPEIISDLEKDGACASYNIIPDFTSGNSPYVIELWESPEFMSNSINSITRSYTVRVDNKDVQKKYKAAGVQSRYNYDVYARLIERSTHAILDMAQMHGRVLREIPDKEVQTKIKPKWSENRELYEKKMIEHEEKILENRGKTVEQYKSHIRDIIAMMVNNQLLTGQKVVALHEVKKDKAKTVKVERCAENDLLTREKENLKIYKKASLNGPQGYLEVADVLQRDPEVFGVFQKKDVYEEFTAGNELYIGNLSTLEPQRISPKRSEAITNVIFTFNYADDSDLKEYDQIKEIDKLSLEMTHIAKLIDYKNIRVLAFPKAGMEATEINVTFDKPSDEVVTKEENKILGINLGPTVQESHPIQKLMQTTYSSKVNDKTIQGEYITSFTRGSIGILSIPRSVDLSDFTSELTNDNLKFLSVYEEDKGKPKKIVVTSNIPLAGSGKYLAYGFTNGSSTSEGVAELKIDKLVNKYDAIAEIKKEESVIQKLLDSNAEIIIEKESGGLFSAGDRLNSELTIFYPKSYLIQP